MCLRIINEEYSFEIKTERKYKAILDCSKFYDLDFLYHATCTIMGKMKFCYFGWVSLLKI